MIQFLLILASTLAASNMPPALVAELDRFDFEGDIESISYDPMRYGFSGPARIVYSPHNEGIFQALIVVECTSLGRSGTEWACAAIPCWRINGTSVVYIYGNDSVNKWISKDPDRALKPYLALVDEAKAIYPEDKLGQPLTAITIDPRVGSFAIFHNFGSGCTTRIRIRSKTSSSGVKFNLDWRDKMLTCY